jgi:D-alanyl-D-alanine carboxypeptidase (penicillin-binding protein 5/6)
MPPKRVFYLSFCILALCCTAFGPPVLTDSDSPRQPFTLEQISAFERQPAPELTAETALLADVPTGEILYAKNERERHAPASLTKIVTAMVALEHGRLDQEMVVSVYDLPPWSTLGLQNGEPLTMNDLMYMMLIPSDNVAATTLARELGGRVSTFVGWMNDLVAAWGLQDTHFGNPHGLDNEESYTTAYDMAIIARLAMQNRTFAEIVGTPETFKAGHTLTSTNLLLNTYSGCIGVKTGTTDEAGQCLITMVKRPSGYAIAVVMGSTDRFIDSRLLLDYYFANFAELHIDLPDTAQNRYLDVNGGWHSFRLSEPVTFLIDPWYADTVTLYRRIDVADANPDPSQPIGALEISWGGQYRTEVPLYAR